MFQRKAPSNRSSKVFISPAAQLPRAAFSFVLFVVSTASLSAFACIQDQPVSSPSTTETTTDTSFSTIVVDPLSLEELSIPREAGSEMTFYGGMIAVSILMTVIVAFAIGWARAVKRLKRLEPLRSQLAIWGRDRLASFRQLTPVPVNGPESLGWNLVLRQFENANAQAQGTHGPGQRFNASDEDSLIEDLPEGFAVCSPDGQIAFVNTALRVLVDEFCSAPQESVSSNSQDSSEATEPAPAEDENEDEQLTKIAEHLAALASDQQILSQRPSVDVVTGSGRAAGRTLRVARHPRFDRSTRQFAGTIWVVRDITQQKLAEKMRDEFLDSATHELRTPLANIKAYAETLALSDVLAVEQQKEFCNTINAEATRLARLIDDLLSISSMEVGSLSVNCQRTEVDRLLKDVVTRVKPTMEKKRQKFHVLIDEKIPEMKLDKDKFATILVNLIGNASKYTPEEGNVTLRARIVESSLLIDVEDTGMGIAEHELPRVFEKFFRSSDPRVQNENGTGLGLSLTQELVRLHGGTLTVRSQLNQGTCFTIRLPL